MWGNYVCECWEDIVQYRWSRQNDIDIAVLCDGIRSRPSDLHRLRIRDLRRTMSNLDSIYYWLRSLGSRKVCHQLEHSDQPARNCGGGCILIFRAVSKFVRRRIRSIFRRSSTAPARAETCTVSTSSEFPYRGSRRHQSGEQKKYVASSRVNVSFLRSSPRPRNFNTYVVQTR